MTVQNDLSREDVASYEAELAKRTPSLYSRYIGAMLYFMGAALIAGAVVHYPVNPGLYTIICVVGAFVFLLGTIVNEFVLVDERRCWAGPSRSSRSRSCFPSASAWSAAASSTSNSSPSAAPG